MKDRSGRRGASGSEHEAMPGCRPVPLGTGQVAFPHPALRQPFRPRSSLLRVWSRVIPDSTMACGECFPFATVCRGGLHSPGITQVHRYAGLHPNTTSPSVRLLFPVARTYSTAAVTSGQERGGPPGCLSISMCCSMPSATPGRKQALVSSAPVSVACVFRHSISLPDVPFGANYRIQLLSLHLATFPPPSALWPQDSNTGRLTRPFPEGFPPSGWRTISRSPPKVIRPLRGLESLVSLHGS